MQSEDVEEGPFIDQVTGLDKVKLKWVKMKLPDGSLIELLQYQHPTQEQKRTKQLSNAKGVSHMAFTVENMDRICEQIVGLVVGWLMNRH